MTTTAPTRPPDSSPSEHRSWAVRIAQHPRRSLLAALLFVVVAGVVGGPVAGALEASGGFTPDSSDSARAIAEIEGATGRAPSPGVVLLVTSPEGVTGDTDRIREVTDTLADEPGIAEVTSVVSAPGAPGLVSEDETASLVLGTLEAGADDEAVAESVLDTFEDADGVEAGGSVISGHQIGALVEGDLARAELLALPLLVLLSLLFFGGRAAVFPLVVGLTTVLGTFLVLTGVNQVYGLSIFALNLVIGLGLGLAIDYTLFLVSRYREEVQRQGATAGAIATTMATAGRTVAFSAATVAVALVTLTVFPLDFIKSMGIAGAIVAVVAATASLVISPALFGLWGAKLLRRPSGRGATEPERSEQSGRWYRLSQAVMRRPALVAVATAAVMVVLALPALRANWTPVDASVIPESQSSRTVADALEADFAGSGETPLTVVTGAESEAAEADVTSYAATLGDLDGVTDVAPPRRLGDDTWQLDVSAQGAPDGDVAQQLVAEIRDVPVAGTALVGGPAAEFVDQQAAIGARLPLAVGLLVGLTMLVLWLMTGSVVLPVKAVIMNALTVGSALGVLTLVYQDGRFAGLLDYTPNGGIEPTDFLVAATLVFALSTDYGVFLLGRIREVRETGVGEREAVAVGLERTGSVVTAAAILLAVAIGAFSTSSISFIQQIGVATAVGVLVDAFVVRSLLVPALMGLLGKYNWWAPMSLRRLHDRIGLREEGAPGVLETVDR